MSADIGVHWRSAVCGSDSHSRSSLSRLPNLIPIRKSNGNTSSTASTASTKIERSPYSNQINDDDDDTDNLQENDVLQINGTIATTSLTSSLYTDVEQYGNHETVTKKDSNGQTNVKQEKKEMHKNMQSTIKQEMLFDADEVVDDMINGAEAAKIISAIKINPTNSNSKCDNLISCNANESSVTNVCQNDQMRDTIDDKCADTSVYIFNKNDEDDIDCIKHSKLLQNEKENSIASNTSNEITTNVVTNANVTANAIAIPTPIPTIPVTEIKKEKCTNVNQTFRRTTRSALDENRGRSYTNHFMTSIPVYSLATVLAANQQEQRRNNRLKAKQRRNGIKLKNGRITKPKKQQQPTKSKSKIIPAANACIAAANNEPHSRINPIFLFVKQDDTRIIEVRCEDYDKRNRIRLTKTASGWRATPHTDETTDKVETNASNNLNNEKQQNRSDKQLLPKVKLTKENHRSEKKKKKEQNLNDDNDIEMSTNENVENTGNWRVNPFSQNRIKLSKDNQFSDASAEQNNNKSITNNNNNSNNNNNNNNNNEDKFTLNYQHDNVIESTTAGTTTDGGTSAAEMSSVETSASDRMQFENESMFRKKHKKKKKKKKKEKNKLKAEKRQAISATVVAATTSNHFTSITNASQEPKQTTSVIDHIYDRDICDAQTQIHPIINETKPNHTNSSDVKFTIRLNRNGETAAIVPKKCTALHSTSSSTITTIAKTTTTGAATPPSNNIEINDATEMPLLEAKKEILTPIPSPTYMNSPSEMHSQDVPAQQSIADAVCSKAQDIDKRIKTNISSCSANDATNQMKCNNKNNNEDNDACIDQVASPDHASVRVQTFDTKPPILQFNFAPIQQKQQQNSIKNINKINHISNQCSDNSDLNEHLTNNINNNNNNSNNCGGNLLNENSFYAPDEEDEIEEEEIDDEVRLGVRNRNSNSNIHENNLSDINISRSDNVHRNDDNNDDDDLHVNQMHHINGENSELSEYDLIAGIRDIHDAHDDILDHCENTMTGAELLDSLVKRGCEANNISGDNDDDIKNTICLPDNYNEEAANLLLGSQPVVDIISRLNNHNTMTTSPKCLSFNEAGEIEALHDSIFSTNGKSVDSMVDSLGSFNTAALEELSMSLKALDKQSTTVTMNEKELTGTTIVSPDSCEDELPKDLSFKKTLLQHQHQHHQQQHQRNIISASSPRPISRSSDAIQSPQPSGLPAVPPSPDILMALHQQTNNMSKNKKQNPLFLDISLPSPKSNTDANGKFVDLSSPLSKDDNASNSIDPPNLFSSRSLLKRTLQREPLDLGSKHRKSASPTVSCSEEVNRLRSLSTSLDDSDSNMRRIKGEQRNSIDSNLLETAAAAIAAAKNSSQSDETSSSAKDPDPLTQLRLLISNPEWRLPDPILVPKDRLSAVLASPAREIPLLLTTRPELRLPEVLNHQEILRDPDILVISFAQLETIIQKQDEFMKESGGGGAANKHSDSKQMHQQTTIHHRPSSKDRNKTHIDKSIELSPRDKSHGKSTNQQQNQNTLPIPSLLGNGMAGDINLATLEALNQMIWLQCLNPLGQLTPEMLKALPFGNLGMQNDSTTFANFTRLLQMQTNPLANFGTGNPIELAMWQEALANNTNMQRERLLKMSAEQNAREAAQRKAAIETKQQQQHQHSRQQAESVAAASAMRRQSQLSLLTPNLMNNLQFFQNAQNQSQQIQHQRNASQQQQQYSPNEYSKKSNRMFNNQNILAAAMASGAAHSNPFLNANSLANLQNFQNLNAFSKFGMGNGMSGAAGNTNTVASALRKVRKEQANAYQQQQQQQQHHHHHHHQQQQNNMENSSKPRVTCKSLMNLLQQSDYGGEQMRSSRISDSSKLSNLMTMPTFDLISPPVTPTTTTQSSNSSSTSSTGGANQPKLKVKPGMHLIDPLAVQRRLIAGQNDDNSVVGSTTNSIDELMTANSGVSNNQQNYSSPWNWTTVTATGE